MIFQTPEREVLRLMALAEPDWESIRLMMTAVPMWGARASFDWPRLRTYADEHQLGGVVRWRCLSPELDGICPEVVREEARAERARLEHYQAAWVADAQEVVSLLEDQDIPYLFMGAPLSYRRFGMDFWPRQVGKISPDFPESARPKVEALRRQAARENLSEHQRGGKDKSASGLHYVQWDYIPDETFYAQAVGARRADVYGVETMIAAPEIMLCTWAAKTHYGATAEVPFTVEAFARIAECAKIADLSVSLSHLKQYAHLMSWYRQEIPTTIRDWCPMMGGAEASWSWHMTEAIYPGTFPEWFLAEADALAGHVGPVVYKWDEWRDDAPPEFSRLWKWVDVPNLEVLLFDHYADITIEKRAAAGLLTELVP